MKTAGNRRVAIPSIGRESVTGKWFAALGKLVARNPWWILSGWLLIVLLALPGARKAPSLLHGGSGDIAGSASLRNDSLLRADFANPYSQLLILAVNGRLANNEDSLAPLLHAVARALESLSDVGAVMTSEQVLDKRLMPPAGSGSMVLIGVKAATVRDAEQAIPGVRRTVDSIMAPFRAHDATLRWAVTGRSALTYDLNHFNAEDSKAAEVKAIPLTLLILLFAFGSLVTAGVPVVLGLVSTTVSLAMVFLLARHWVFSNLIQNVSSMIGLAVGIDYSLLIIHRYREALAGKLSARGGKSDRIARAEALVESMGKAGMAVFFSGFTVMIGLGGMLFTPLMETRSIGWGGCLVVFISVTAALTLLPALIIVLGPALDWPRAWTKRFAGRGPGRRWTAWSHWVMGKAPFCAVLGLTIIVLLSLPARLTRFGFPEGDFIPKELEFSKAFDMLKSMGMQGLVRPINIILTTKDKSPVLTAARIAGLYDFSDRIKRDSSVARIFGPLDLADHWPLAKYQSLYADTADAFERLPTLHEFFLSRDGRSMLMQVILKDDVRLEPEKRLARAIPNWMKLPDLDISVGGQGVYYNDFDAAMAASYAPTIVFVMLVTLVSMISFFKSPLVSLKAIVMNSLSVLAGYGAVVYVFQLGHGSAFFGTGRPTDVVPLTLPLMLFCLLFGLSMDYEVFLLSRVREGFLKTGDNTRSVAEGLAATGPVITSAAMIMVAVFGAFAFAKMVVVQMIGFGLATAVLVDATLIRAFLVPAFMKMVGKWNWWPWVTSALREER